MNTFVDDINSLKNFHSFRGVNTVGYALLNEIIKIKVQQRINI